MEEKKKKAENILRRIIRKLEIYSVCGNWKKFFEEDIEYYDSLDGENKWIFVIWEFNNTDFIGIVLDISKYEGYIEYKHNGIDIKKKLDHDIIRSLINATF
jgi:hypothetical protein